MCPLLHHQKTTASFFTQLGGLVWEDLMLHVIEAVWLGRPQAHVLEGIILLLKNNLLWMVRTWTNSTERYESETLILLPGPRRGRDGIALRGSQGSMPRGLAQPRRWEERERTHKQMPLLGDRMRTSKRYKWFQGAHSLFVGILRQQKNRKFLKVIMQSTL